MNCVDQKQLLKIKAQKMICKYPKDNRYFRTEFIEFNFICPREYN